MSPNTNTHRSDQFQAAVSETHTAVVVFLEDRVYKVKKKVDLGFLDFSTVTARRDACNREIELNRRFSPDVYEGVAEVHFPWAEKPEPMVVMRRMPDERRLSRLVTTGTRVDDPLRRVARLLATCHAQSPQNEVIRKEGSRDALLSRWRASFDQVRALGETAAMEDLAEIQQRVERYLSGRDDLFASRIREGRVVDGHGDLLADDIFCLEDGPRVLDCLEFDDGLRYVDGIDDAAFLAMDLERLGAQDEAEYFLARYSEYSGDSAPASLWHHYVAYRAFVRAKVYLFQRQQGKSGALAETQRLAEITVRHLRTSAVRMIIVGGPPASGKSTLAAALSDRLGLTLLSSDRVRKELAGLAPDEPAASAYQTGIYKPEWTDRTYGELIARAKSLVRAGESVVIDATWSSAAHRANATVVARDCSADLVSLLCTVPSDVAARRLVSRPHGPSDADASISEAILAAFAPWPEAVSVDTSGTLAAAVGRAMTVICPEDTGGKGRIFRRPYMELG